MQLGNIEFNNKLTFVVVHHFRETKVTDLGNIILPHENVPGREVSVHDLQGGEIVQTSGYGVAPGVEQVGVEGTLQVSRLVLKAGLRLVSVVQQEALEVAQQGRTSITIAHRLSTIMESDRSAFGDNEVEGGDGGERGLN